MDRFAVRSTDPTESMSIWSSSNLEQTEKQSRWVSRTKICEWCVLLVHITPKQVGGGAFGAPL